MRLGIQKQELDDEWINKEVERWKERGEMQMKVYREALIRQKERWISLIEDEQEENKKIIRGSQMQADKIEEQKMEDEIEKLQRQ